MQITDYKYYQKDLISNYLLVIPNFVMFLCTQKF